MPRFSVLIPVRYRPIMARIAVRTALADDEDLEVVVGDNCDERLDLGIDDPRLRVVRNDRVLSMPDNWERVLREARGEWVSLLSDKCRIVPGVLSALADFAGSGAEVITFSRGFFVQDLDPLEATRVEALEGGPGKLHLPSPPPFHLAERNSRDALRLWYANPVYANPVQPMLYNALVRRRVILALLQRKPVFVGMAPDVSSSLAMLAVTKQFVETNVPGTLVQLPSAKFEEWSNGYALARGGRDARRFMDEFGGKPLERYQLPETSAAIVLQTLLAFRDACPDAVPSDAQVDWARFAEFAAAEIANFPASRRPLLHLELLRSTQREGWEPRAVLSHARSVARTELVHAASELVRALPRLHALYRKVLGESLVLKRKSTSSDIPIEFKVDSLDGALSLAARHAADFFAQQKVANHAKCC